MDYNKPPKNFADATSREDVAEWMEAHRKEYQGFKYRDAVNWSFLYGDLEDDEPIYIKAPDW